jgi:hypothetical protein
MQRKNPDLNGRPFHSNAIRSVARRLTVEQQAARHLGQNIAAPTGEHQRGKIKKARTKREYS